MYRHNRFHLICFFVLGFFILILPAWSIMNPPKTIDVVLDNNCPPYVFYDSTGALQGILVDEWALFEKKTGIKVNLHAMDWGDALTAMEMGEYDVIDTLFKNPDREKIYAFSKPYTDINVSIFFNKSISGINTVESLKGFTVAVKRGDNAIHVLKTAGISNISVFDSYEDIIKAASTNEVLVFVVDDPPARYFLYKYVLQDAFNHTSPLYTGTFHRAVLKNNASIIKIIEDGFSKINVSEHQTIQDKWFGKSDFVTKVLSTYLKYLLIAILLIFLTLVVWNRTLQRSVHKKTASLIIAVEDLSYTQSKLKAIMTAMPDWVFVINNEGVIVDFLSSHNKADLLVHPSNFINHKLSEFFDSALTERFTSAVAETLSTGITQTLEYVINEPKTLYYESRYEKLNDSEVVSVVRNITERHETEQTIHNLSILDLPTDLYNRNYFESQMDLYKKTSLEGLSFLLVDFDGLKLVNDTLGHHTGDAYLKTVASLLTEVFSTAEFIARIGGDEFCVVLKNCPEDQIFQLKKQTQEMIASLNVTNQTIPLSISMGYASYSSANTTFEEILKAADDFMYREKLFHRQSVRSRNLDILNAMLEERDFMTQDHGDRMSNLIAKLSKICKISDTEIESLTLFARFHDIGKIGISEAILSKPNRLTPKEFNEVKRHTEIGYRIAESSLDLMHISEWIYKHHEWWDGSGYPFGLSEENIPLPCRMLAIINAFDAMTNDRPYRLAMTLEESIAELRAKSGTQFDPNLIEPFISLINRL